MKRVPSKEALREELLEVLSKDLEALERAQKATVAGATHAEAKPENDKDTRALEQSYLARGQAQRVVELRLAGTQVQTMTLRPALPGAEVALGTLVSLEDEDGEASLVFVAPAGGGVRLAQGRVQVITPKSPLGQALLGKTKGQDAEVRGAGKLRVLTIINVE